MFFDTDAKRCCINDKSTELINLYNCAREKNEDLIKYLQLEINEFSSLGTFVDEHTSDILGLYLSKTSVDDFIEKHSSFFSKLAKGYRFSSKNSKRTLQVKYLVQPSLKRKIALFQIVTDLIILKPL